VDGVLLHVHVEQQRRPRHPVLLVSEAQEREALRCAGRDSLLRVRRPPDVRIRERVELTDESVRESTSASQWLAQTRKAYQQGRVLKSRCHLADGVVECVGLRPPVVQKRAEGEVELELCHAILPRSRVSLSVPLD
jgi:hypothetical protein